MKKIIFVVLVLFMFLFSSIIVNAEATLETEETSVGSIKVNLAFKQGYVGAVDAYIKVQGNVDVNNLIWDNSLGTYIKRYSYDVNSKIIRIIISTGDSTKNLVDKYGVLNVGELKLSNNTGVTQSYSLTLMDVDMVDAEYKTNNDLVVSDGSLGEYVIRVDNVPVTPDKPVNPGNNNENTTYPSVTPNRPSDDLTTDEDNNNEDNESEIPNDNIDDKDNEQIQKPIIDSNKNNNNKDKDKDTNQSNKVETHNQRIVKYLWIVLGSLIVIAIILAAIYAKKQNKINKMQ